MVGRDPHLRHLILCPLLLPAAFAENYVYVGDLTPDSVLLAWGAASGPGNTIGRDSKLLPGVRVTFDGKPVATTSNNWVRVDGLSPDTRYAYQVFQNANLIGKGAVRTWPAKTDRVAFLVIGDYGNGSPQQGELAPLLCKIVTDRQSGADPIRFILTTGDNIYGWGWKFLSFGTGNRDKHWEKRFFHPYRDALAQAPFYPTPGNHDGNQTEHRSDLTVYLDNFFYPGPKFPDPASARWYRFAFGGGLAEFFSLDSTNNTLSGDAGRAYAENGPQSVWLKKALEDSRARWKIPYFHNPPVTAGPEHPPAARELGHWMRWFEQYKVALSFSGHEHNFQIAKQTPETGAVRYVVSGAGGMLRPGDVRTRMDSAGVEAWAPRRHFLLVEVNRDSTTITPIGASPPQPVRGDGSPFPLPLVVPARVR